MSNQKFNFDKEIERKGTASVKYDLLNQRFGSDDVLAMWVADADFEAPPAVVKAIKERAEHGIYGYSIRPETYFETIATWSKRRYNWELNPEWISFSPGVVPGIAMAIQAFTTPGDKIVVQPPVYFPFFSTVIGMGRQLVENPLKREGNTYLFDFDDLRRKIDNRTKMLILCSPHNPVGRVWQREELHELASICLENNILVLSDEIHADLTFAGQQHIPLASLGSHIAQQTITAIAPSKTFNIAGLSTSSFIFPNQHLRDDFNNLLNTTHLWLGNLFGTVASIAAYREGEEWLNAMLNYVYENYLLVKNTLAKEVPQIQVIQPEGTYLLWLDCSGLNMSDEELKAFFVKKARVAMNPGSMFGTGGSGFQRINVACPRSVIREALQRIVAAIRDLP